MLLYPVIASIMVLILMTLTIMNAYAQANDSSLTNRTSNNNVKSTYNTSFFYQAVLPIFGIMGAFSFGLNVYTLYQNQMGFLRPMLECDYISKDNELYLVCKTKIENSSRRPIPLRYAFLLIEDHPTSGIGDLYQLEKKVSDLKKNKDRP